MSHEVIPARLLLGAYAQGIFPMGCEGEIEWFSPEKRGVIPLDERFHVPHGLQRSLRKNPFEVRVNTAFLPVMQGCAEREETWIDEVILASYAELHRLGYAHSVECWDAEGLQGGLYGVELPGVFFGESMFSRKTDASKVALVALVDRLRACGFHLLDTQWLTPHLKQFGGEEIPRRKYHQMLENALSRGSQRFSSSRPSGNPL
jgi:leucyl/phenylalanyl-tRNA--protein transferase